MSNNADNAVRSATSTGICDRNQAQPIVQTHPQFKCRREDYNKIQDCLEGERWIKEKGVQYLPKTSAQATDDSDGGAYEAYKTRAIYYNYPKDTADSALGMMHREPPTFELPEGIQSLIKRSGPDGVPLEDAMQDINKGQIEYARFGLLNDIPETENPDSPHIIKYHGTMIINWNDEIHEGILRLRMVTLNESGYQITVGGNHIWEDRYRMCALDEEGNYWTKVMKPEEISKIDYSTFEAPLDATFPHFKGRTIDFVPFTFINITNLKSMPEVSPILDICDLSIAVFRKEADYGQAQFMQGQATPWATGLQEDEQPTVLGATNMMFGTSPEAEFGFMEVTGSGLTGMKDAIDDVKAQAIGKGVSLVETGQQESGKALSIRTSSKTSILKTIAITGAQGLTQALQQAAEWMGDEWNDEENKIAPNLDFVDEDTSNIADEFLKIMQARMMGAPISEQSIHEYARKKDLTAKTYEQEKEDMNGDGIGLPPTTPPASQPANQDNADA